MINLLLVPVIIFLILASLVPVWLGYRMMKHPSNTMKPIVKIAGSIGLTGNKSKPKANLFGIRFNGFLLLCSGIFTLILILDIIPSVYFGHSYIIKPVSNFFSSI